MVKCQPRRKTANWKVSRRHSLPLCSFTALQHSSRPVCQFSDSCALAWLSHQQCPQVQGFSAAGHLLPQSTPPGYVWECLETFLVVTTESWYWHPKGRGREGAENDNTTEVKKFCTRLRLEDGPLAAHSTLLVLPPGTWTGTHTWDKRMRVCVKKPCQANS